MYFYLFVLVVMLKTGHSLYLSYQQQRGKDLEMYIRSRKEGGQ